MISVFPTGQSNDHKTSLSNSMIAECKLQKQIISIGLKYYQIYTLFL